MFRRVFLLSVVPLLSLQYVRAQSCRVTNLQCEYLANPIGIDNVHPRLTWQMDDANTGSYQKSYQLVVGTDALEVSNGKGNRWQTVQTASAARLVAYNGQALKPFTKYYWRVRVGTNKNDYAVSATASFETGMLSVSHWEGTWISDGEDRSAQPAPYFRKVFQAHKPILSARAYIVAAGLYELYVNGEKIGDHRLSPAYTRYDRRNLYVTYDLTKNMREGHNALGVILGNGWYNFQSIAVWDYERAPWRNRPAFCMDVRITYKDGSEETVRSDKSWKTATGPIVYNSLYTGEHYDARLEQAGWNTTGFDDSKWDGVTVRQAPAENITAESMQPVRHVEGIKPVSMTKRNDSTYLFDLGRNIAGVSRVTLSGRRGTVVRVVHAERLDKNGDPDQSNVDYFLAKGTRGQDPFATDIYTLRGAGAETFMPHFDYKGFQYVEVQADKPISLAQDDLTAYFMHSDVAQVGYIHTSNDLINKIYAATNVSYLSNLVGYPTDCPQREKNGWTGDAHIASETGLYNFDAITL